LLDPNELFVVTNPGPCPAALVGGIEREKKKGKNMKAREDTMDDEAEQKKSSRCQDLDGPSRNESPRRM
jgi:hypothetical protein